MKDTYRERIKEEQKKLSPQQFFTRTLQMGLPAGMTERGLASTLIIQSLAAFWNWNKKVTAWLEF